MTPRQAVQRLEEISKAVARQAVQRLEEISKAVEDWDKVMKHVGLLADENAKLRARVAELEAENATGKRLVADLLATKDIYDKPKWTDEELAAWNRLEADAMGFPSFREWNEDRTKLITDLLTLLGVVEAARKVKTSRHQRVTSHGEPSADAMGNAEHYVLHVDELAAALAKWDEAAKP